ncbi:MAG: PAS domain S-box protein [Methylocystaceae bacterium]
MNAKSHLNICNLFSESTAKPVINLLTNNFRQYIDIMPESVAVVNKQGIILEWNIITSQVTGLSADKVIGRHWREIFDITTQSDTVDHTEFITLFEDSLNNLGQPGDKVTARKTRIFNLFIDNQPKWCEYFILPLSRDGEPVLSIISRDITARTLMENELMAYRDHLEDIVDQRTAELQEANAMLQTEIAYRQAVEAKLREKNQQLELIMETAQTPIYLKDGQGYFLQVNQAFVDLFGYSPEQVIGNTMADLISSENLPLHLEVDHQIEEAPTSYRHQTTILFKDGIIRDLIFNLSALVDEQGKFAGQVGVVTDITDKMSFDKKLNHSRAWFDHCFNNNLYGICITKAESGEIVDMNDTALHMFGYEKEALIGHTLVDSGIWANSYGRDKLLQDMEVNGYIVNCEVTFRDIKGNLIPFLLSSHKFEFENEFYLFTVLNNVREYIQAAKDIARLDRLNIIGEMAASIGHEIRNPMTAVKGLLQLIKNEEQHDGHNDFFDLMIGEMDRANSIITEFLSLAPDKLSQPQYMSLNQIINNVYPLLNAEALCQDKHIILQLDEVPALKLDANEIRQLIVNLVKNALEASQPKDYVTITTTRINDGIRLAIIDQGSGIPAEVLDNIWKPFITTKINGTGLGLPVCFSIASRHQATIKAISNSSGTTIEVVFPLTASLSD